MRFKFVLRTLPLVLPLGTVTSQVPRIGFDVEPMACPAADSLVGRTARTATSRLTGVRPGDPVMVAGRKMDTRMLFAPDGFRVPSGTTVAFWTRAPFWMSQARPGPGASGLVDFLAGARLEAGQPNPVRFTFLVVSSAPRSEQDRQLAFVLDDTLHQAMGPTVASRVTWQPTSGVAEQLSIDRPFRRLIQLSLANQLRAELGGTPFVLSDQQVADLRSLAVVALCHGVRSPRGEP